MKRYASITLALVVALVLAYAAWAQAPPAPGGPPPQGPPPQGPPPGMGMPGMGMGGPGGFRPMMQPCPMGALNPPSAMMFEMGAERLHLSNEQVDKLKTLVINAEQTLRPLREKCRETTDALRAGLFAPDKDANALRGLADNAEKAEAAVIAAELDVWVKVKTTLNPEQLKMLQEMMGRGRGPMPMMPPPNGTQPPVPPGPRPPAGN